MSKFLSGRQSNLKLGVAGYTENKTVLETTGKVGIGTTDAQSYSLFVVGDTNVTGLVSATAFYGDGSNLENTGATLSAAAGTQRLVVTSLTSGTMVDAATDSDLTYNATTDTLNVENIDVDGHTELDQLRVTGVSTFAGNVDISSNGNLTVAGNLIVQGTETRLNTTVLEVEDINIGIASVTPTLSDAALDGAGITIHGSQGDKTLTWSNANSRMEFNTDVNVANLRLDDGQYASFGDGDDLKIFHNGTKSYIANHNVGNLIIQNGVDDGDVVINCDDGSGSTIQYFRADGSNGEVVLYHYGSEKFATKSDGIDVTGHTETDTLRVSGVSTFQGNVDLGDNDRLRFGDSQDLQIYHNSSNNNSVIAESGSGSLNINADKIKLQSATGGETLGVFREDGSVSLNYDNSKKFETTSYGVKIYDDLNVGTGVTIYGNAGIVSAISFYGDGSNLTNTGATLSATSGTERLVTTQLTSGTMVAAATDADLTFNATTNLLHTPKIDVAGLSPDGTTFGVSGYVPVADGSGGWNWGSLQGASSVNTILNGFTVSEEGNVVGTAGSITQIDFRGVNILASAASQPNGIATITMSETPTFEQINITGITTLGGPVTAGSSEGVVGQYLRHVGTGVTWASFPQLRVTQTNNAFAGQTTFNFTYNIDFLDVFVNGVKLTSSEYIANNGSQIVLNTPAFAGEVVEFHSYNITSSYGGGGGGGASNLNGLSDVNFPIALADNQLIQFNTSTGVWENVSAATVVGAASSFATKVATATTATAGQTTFSGTYTVGFVDVFLNGVKQSEDQYTASTGTNIVLDEGASEDDIVEVVGLTANVPGSGGGGGGSSYTNTDVDSHLNVSGASSNQILSWTGSDYAWVEDQSNIAGISTTGTSYFNNINASGTVTASSFSGITTSMISDYGNGISGGGGGISLTDLSVTTANTPLQLGALAYNNSNGVFTFTPPDIVGQARPGFSVGTANNPLQLGAISYNSSNGEFKYTPPDLSSYQQKTGDGSALTGIVTSIVAGTNVTVSNTGGTYTINSSGGGGASGPDPVMMGMIF